MPRVKVCINSHLVYSFSLCCGEFVDGGKFAIKIAPMRHNASAQKRAFIMGQAGKTRVLIKTILFLIFFKTISSLLKKTVLKSSLAFVIIVIKNRRFIKRKIIMREKIYQVLEPSKESNDVLGKVYDFFMIGIIIISIIPLAFKTHYRVFDIIEYVTVAIFIVDYLLRWLTADFKLNKKALSFIVYPITPMAIIDLVSILPSLTILNSGFKLLKMFRLLRALRVFRSLKVLRYSKSFAIIATVLKKEKKTLIAVATMAIAYIFISALVIYNVEPDSFNNLFDAIYWATVSLTTVGYGDIYPVTTIGRIVTMISSVFGIAIIALPSGVITAGYLSEVNKEKNDNNNGTDNHIE